MSVRQQTILFDTGNSADGFEHNIKALGVDLTSGYRRALPSSL
jgi:metal-dependent hydrolase (beta-lactamase superfamily II)